jgi:ATP-dependent protease ClpP protease subunit
MPDIVVDGEIVLFGTVGADFWGDDCFTSRQVIEALAGLGGKDVTVRVNSGGGDVFEGVAIHNALRAHKGAVSVRIEGIAASAASIIAMAGKTVTMGKGAVMMVHDPSMITWGTAADHDKSKETLEAIAGSMATIYADKTGKTPEECRTQMRAEIWMTAEEARANGYADELIDEDGDEESVPTAFAYRLYAAAPAAIAAMADANGWSARELHARVGGAQPRHVAPSALTATAARPRGTDIPQDVTDEARSALDSDEKRRSRQQEDLTAMADSDRQEGAAVATANAEKIVTMCIDAGVAVMAAALIREGLDADKAKARIDGAKEIKAAVENARRICPEIDAALADRFIAAGTSLADVRADLFDRIAKAGARSETFSAHDPYGTGQGGGGKVRINAGEIYAARADARAKRRPQAAA